MADSDLFAGPSRTEMQQRNVDRVKNCAHIWYKKHMDHIRLVADHAQISVVERCQECKAHRSMILLVDDKANVIKSEIRVKEWTKEDQDREDEEKKEQYEKCAPMYPSISLMSRQEREQASRYASYPAGISATEDPF